MIDDHQIVIIQPKQPLLAVPESLATATGQTRDHGGVLLHSGMTVLRSLCPVLQQKLRDHVSSIS